jgi:hypothetical protein
VRSLVVRRAGLVALPESIGALGALRRLDLTGIPTPTAERLLAVLMTRGATAYW